MRRTDSENQAFAIRQGMFRRRSMVSRARLRDGRRIGKGLELLEIGYTDLQKILINITDELREVLDGITAKTGQSLSETIEFFLRRDKAIKAVRTEWPARTVRGRPKKPKP